jgi:hypothetical protein
LVVLSIIGLGLFQRLIVPSASPDRGDEQDIIFFASTIAVFYSLTVGLIAVGGMDDLHPGREHGVSRGDGYRLLLL